MRSKRGKRSRISGHLFPGARPESLLLLMFSCKELMRGGVWPRDILQIAATDYKYWIDPLIPLCDCPRFLLRCKDLPCGHSLAVLFDKSSTLEGEGALMDNEMATHL